MLIRLFLKQNVYAISLHISHNVDEDGISAIGPVSGAMLTRIAMCSIMCIQDPIYINVRFPEGGYRHAALSGFGDRSYARVPS